MKGLIDFRNEKLWNDINGKYNVTFKDSTNGEYSCYSENENITFFIVNEDLCKGSFTHEMLHVYLRMKDCFIGAGLKNTIGQSKILTSMLSFELLEHMGNCLDHIKMFPIYLNMGFERENFILDYNSHKCLPEELTSLKRNYRIGTKVNPKAVDLFIGLFFAMSADPNKSFDYSQQLETLRKIDHVLFQINQRMIDLWLEIRIEDRQFIDDDYHSVLFEYYDDFKKWISNNKIAS